MQSATFDELLQAIQERFDNRGLLTVSRVMENIEHWTRAMTFTPEQARAIRYQFPGLDWHFLDYSTKPEPSPHPADPTATQ